ncbi:MAG: hypothetical protein LPL00_01335 [Alphaproteobacteria bacterium]|nr:hypothetical protein [Alphaproteobacteria bacterium]MDX5368037.1 hypothetical protein [Alphaproteobacteria bacterium]MDX5462879.1 hypothetical protein [Alphaproteobacteria bacterium]
MSAHAKQVGPRGFASGGGGAANDAARRCRARFGRPAANRPSTSVLVCMILLFLGGALLLPRGMSGPAVTAPPAGAAAASTAEGAPLSTLGALVRPAADLLSDTAEAPVGRIARGLVAIDLTRRVLPPLAAPQFPEAFLPTPVIEARVAEAAHALEAAEAGVFEARRRLGAVRRLVGNGPDPEGRLLAARRALAEGEGARVRAEAAWSVPAAQLETRRLERMRDRGVRNGRAGRHS